MKNIKPISIIVNAIGLIAITIAFGLLIIIMTDLVNIHFNGHNNHNPIVDIVLFFILSGFFLTVFLSCIGIVLNGIRDYNRGKI